MRARNFFTGTLLHFAITFLPVFLLFKPVRTLLKRFVTAPGDGPDKTAQGKERIQYRALAIADVDGPAVKRAYSTARYNGGMYYRKSLSALLNLSVAN